LSEDQIKDGPAQNDDDDNDDVWQNAVSQVLWISKTSKN
jgi:hypothetical protein